MAVLFPKKLSWKTSAQHVCRNDFIAPIAKHIGLRPFGGSPNKTLAYASSFEVAIYEIYLELQWPGVLEFLKNNLFNNIVIEPNAQESSPKHYSVKHKSNIIQKLAA